MATRVYPPENVPDWILASDRRAIGNDSRCYLQPGSRLRVDKFGVSNLMRSWKCRTDLVERFEPKDGDLDFLHRDLTVWEWDIVHGENWESTIEIQYNGIRPAQTLPQRQRPRKSLREQTLSNVSGQTITIVYYTTTINLMYATKEEPRFQDEYIAASGITLPRIRPIRAVGSNGFSYTLGNLPQVLKSLGFIYETPIMRVDLDVEPVGKIFNVTEVLERQIVQPSVFIAL